MTSSPRLARSSVSSEVAALLLDRILSGQIRAGTPLREAALAEEFEASRNSIREALSRLEHDGVIRRRAHRGSRVVEPDDAAVEEIMAYRMVVEPGAIRRLAGARFRSSARSLVAGGRDHPLDPVGSIVDEMEHAGRSGDWKRYGMLDLDFHSALVEAAGGTRLGVEFRRTTRPLYIRLLAYDQGEPGASRSHIGEHRAILDHILDGRRARATLLIDQHLEDAESALFARTPGATGPD